MEVVRAQRITQRLLNIVFDLGHDPGRDSEPNPVMGLRFDILSRMVGDAVFVVDSEGIITHWNKAAQKTFGYLSSEIVGQPFYRLILPAEDTGILDAEMKVFLETGEGPLKHKELNISLFHKQGYAVKIKLRFSAAEVDNKWSMIGVARLPSDFEAEKEDIIRRAETQSRLAALGRLAGGVAHEIKNYGTAMKSFPDLIAENVLKMFNSLINLDLAGAMEIRNQIREDLNYIKLSAAKIEHLTRNFMNFGERSIETQILFSPNEILENVLEMIEPSFRKKHVLLRKMITPDLPKLLGQPGIFEQIIYNLLNNAWYATPKKGIVRIKAYSDENNILIIISDTGYGIPKELQDRIFEPFYSTKGRESGTGLGLSIVKRCIKKMGGKIKVRSEVNEGTIFTISLPCVDQLFS